MNTWSLSLSLSLSLSDLPAGRCPIPFWEWLRRPWDAWRSPRKYSIGRAGETHKYKKYTRGLERPYFGSTPRPNCWLVHLTKINKSAGLPLLSYQRLTRARVSSVDAHHAADFLIQPSLSVLHQLFFCSIRFFFCGSILKVYPHYLDERFNSMLLKEWYPCMLEKTARTLIAKTCGL